MAAKSASISSTIDEKLFFLLIGGTKLRDTETGGGKARGPIVLCGVAFEDAMAASKSSKCSLNTVDTVRMLRIEPSRSIMGL
jgi:hypothetical protein